MLEKDETMEKEIIAKSRGNREGLGTRRGVVMEGDGVIEVWNDGGKRSNRGR